MQRQNPISQRQTLVWVATVSVTMLGMVGPPGERGVVSHGLEGCNEPWLKPPSLSHLGLVTSSGATYPT